MGLHIGYKCKCQQNLINTGVHTSLVKAAVLREIAEGIVPQRQVVQGRVPFKLMKSEILVWIMEGVDYLETVVPRTSCKMSPEDSQ